MFRKSILAAMALTVAAPASAIQSDAPSPPLAASSPPVASDWVHVPNAAELAELYPRVALRNRVNGLSKVKCSVAADGKPTDCAIISECPAGLGFGEALLKATRYFRVRPKTIDGRPATLIIPLKWQSVGGSLPAECASKR